MDTQSALSDLEPVPLKRVRLEQSVLLEDRAHASRSPERGFQTRLHFPVQVPEPRGALSRCPHQHSGPVIEGIVWKLSTGTAWRGLPGRHGPWRTVYEWLRRWSVEGTRNRFLAHARQHSDSVGATARTASGVRRWPVRSCAVCRVR
ncbi:transposase [Streptomyces niveus]|uniref:transposase n=1 Tax=Streptomyces niveus TaxID=193462 RepID=UPI003F4DAE51